MCVTELRQKCKACNYAQTGLVAGYCCTMCKKHPGRHAMGCMRRPVDPAGEWPAVSDSEDDGEAWVCVGCGSEYQSNTWWCDGCCVGKRVATGKREAFMTGDELAAHLHGKTVQEQEVAPRPAQETHDDCEDEILQYVLRSSAAEATQGHALVPSVPPSHAGVTRSPRRSFAVCAGEVQPEAVPLAELSDDDVVAQLRAALAVEGDNPELNLALAEALAEAGAAREVSDAEYAAKLHAEMLLEEAAAEAQEARDLAVARRLAREADEADQLAEVRLLRDRLIAEDLQAHFERVSKVQEDAGYAAAQVLQEGEENAQQSDCRFCGSLFATDGTFHHCSNEECHRKSLLHCNHRLPCGHFCIGCRGEPHECHVTYCPACKGDEEEEDCPLCLEPLSDHPCVQLPCHESHIAHKHCLLAQLKHAPFPQPGGPIVFSALFKCPHGCGAFLDHPMLQRARPVPVDRDGEWADIEIVDNEGIDEDEWSHHRPMQNRDTKSLVSLCERVGTMAVRTAVREGMELPEQGDALRRRRAIEAYSLFLCKVCEQPFVGGRRECDVANPAANPPAGEARNDAVCKVCMMKDSGKACKKHPDGVQIKCDFCCMPALFFCFGNTHFCQECHSDNVSAKKVKPCNPAKCPLRGKHPKGRTKAYIMGCIMCRDEAQMDM